MEMRQCVSNCDSHQSGKNHEERKICEDFTGTLGVGYHFVFQFNKYLKHTSVLVRNYLQKTNMIVTHWAAESPDLDYTENRWGELKTNTNARKLVKPEDSGDSPKK